MSILFEIALRWMTQDVTEDRDGLLHQQGEGPTPVKPKEEAVVFHWSGGKTDQIKQEAI